MTTYWTTLTFCYYQKPFLRNLKPRCSMPMGLGCGNCNKGKYVGTKWKLWPRTWFISFMSYYCLHEQIINLIGHIGVQLLSPTYCTIPVIVYFYWYLRKALLFSLEIRGVISIGRNKSTSGGNRHIITGLGRRPFSEILRPFNYW